MVPQDNMAPPYLFYLYPMYLCQVFASCQAEILNLLHFGKYETMYFKILTPSLVSLQFNEEQHERNNEKINVLNGIYIYIYTYIYMILLRTHKGVDLI